MTRSSKRLLLAVVLGMFGLFLLHKRGILAPVYHVTELITVPVARVTYGARQKLEVIIFPPLARVHTLEQKLAALSFLSAKVEMVEKENQALRLQLEGKIPQANKTVVARVLGGDRYLLIDRGKNAGVSIGNTVVYRELLVGKVIAVTEGTATLLLPTDPDSKIPAWTAKLTRGIVQGSFGRALVFGHVLQGDELAVNDVVLTTGEDGYAQNIGIGKLKTLVNEVRDVYKQGELVPFVDYRKLQVVFVIINKQ